jgi:hypothetical protein
MAAKLTRLTHKIAIQLHLVAEGLPFAVLALGGKSGIFWIHPRSVSSLCLDAYCGNYGSLRPTENVREA